MDVNERRNGVRLFWVWKQYLGKEIVWLVGYGMDGRRRKEGRGGV